MKRTETDCWSGKECRYEKILFLLLPFWDPQIPPLGLACLKSFLKEEGFAVTAVDTNLNLEFREIYDGYFNILETHIPANKRGNLYNIGNQVLRNHMMAHLNYDNWDRYLELLKIVVHRTFYYELAETKILELERLITRFYLKLEEYIIDLLGKKKPAVLGLSLYCDTLPASMFVAQLVKKTFPGIKVIVGGGIFADQLAPGSPNLDIFLEKTRSYIDKAIVGEGEELVLKFLKGESSDSRRIESIQNIGNKTVDITSVKIPDFSDFDVSQYPHLAHYGARSCPYQCKFCSETVSWGKYRKKSARQTVRELMELSRRYSYQLFLMTDSLLNPVATNLAEEVIKQNAPVYWDGFLRVAPAVCDSRNTFLWREGGFYRAKLGIETGSDRVLKLMEKQITVEQIEQAIPNLAYAGIKTTTFWLFGFPGETEEDFQQTLDLIEKLKDNIYEADANVFNYYLTGQANSNQWLNEKKSFPLYPQWAADMLVTQTWVMDCAPSREEAYQRLNRFIEHIDNLGIPNPYSLKEIHRADERWKRLHKNAVPPLVRFKKGHVPIKERENLKKISAAGIILTDADDNWF